MAKPLSSEQRVAFEACCAKLEYLAHASLADMNSQEREASLSPEEITGYFYLCTSCIAELKSLVEQLDQN